jgi:hypothetical protein
MICILVFYFLRLVLIMHVLWVYIQNNHFWSYLEIKLTELVEVYLTRLKETVTNVVVNTHKINVRIDLILIDTKFGRENMVRSPQLRPGEDWNHLMPELTPNQIFLVVKTKKNNTQKKKSISFRFFIISYLIFKFNTKENEDAIITSKIRNIISLTHHFVMYVNS